MSLNTRPWRTTLWVITVVVALGLVVSSFAHQLTIPFILVQIVFLLLHGARRYGWSGIAAFVVAGLLISNILENLSIATGFPFGNYYYTGDGKIFEVPWFIGPAYLATGYLAWVVATVLLGDVRRGSSWLTTIGTPVIAAFTMTLWDLSMDPTLATIGHNWIWEDGGGYFGVPLGNFLGWTFTVYLFMQVFALYVRSRGPQPAAGPDLAGSRTRDLASDLQGVVLYGLTGVGFVVAYFIEEHTTVTDATGAVWNTADIYETSALVTVYGMFFFALVALLRIAQQHLTPAPSATSDERTTVSAS
ncbi:carotenoid biosynthesis protein [Promicromonospora sp. Populi]|uniref:carotenoid biosynthesis protein n=1 Tax=Promicromonospora sp. Populi TaxID=3239420 RepID=UPI0034E200B8